MSWDAPQPYSVERTSRSMLTIRMGPVVEGWEQEVMLGSDVHFDHPLCDRRLFFRHLSQAQQKRAPVLLFGDTNDVMQTKLDRRASKDDLRPELKAKNYLDVVVDEATQKLRPYADVIELMSLGNHDDDVTVHHETNVAERIAAGLGAAYMPFAGFVRFMFSGRKGNRTQRLLYFHHGAGGGGEVTRGMIKTNRRAVYLGDPHVIVAGHIHEKWLAVIPRVRTTTSGRWYIDNQYHVQCSTYKQEYDLESDGFHMRNERQPKPLGGWWLKFRYNPDWLGNVEIDFGLAQ
jgi:UDP-2,3-diacylglucosamine pyrophosphatase LpxH